MRRKVWTLALGAILAVGLAPLSSQANHCDIFMLSGVTGVAGANAGAIGCANATAHANTSYITLGADYLRAAVLVSLSPSVPTNGKVTFLNGTAVISTHTVTFAIDPGSTGRYVSASLTIPGATTAVKAEATLTAGPRSVTYQRVV